MWRNFGSSIGLLSIAMMAALYSSSAARDGRLVEAAISALVALAIALWVAIRFVPRLASNIESRIVITSVKNTTAVPLDLVNPNG